MAKKYLFFSALFLFIIFICGCSNKSSAVNNNFAVSLNEQTQQIKTEKNSNENEKDTENVTHIDESSINNNDKNKQVIDNKKEKNITIVIDPGHGGKITSEKEPIAPGSKIMKAKNVSGAFGIVTKTPEYSINLSVSMKLKEYLNNAGYKVIMTRTSNSETIGNIQRAEIGNKNNADLVMRIHADSSADKSVKGASMLVPGNVGYAQDIYKISKKYGETILKKLIDEAGMKSRGVITRTDLTGFNWSKVPVVLIEMGFLSNTEEDKLLSSDDYQQKIALGLFKGIEEIFNNEK
ncbi:N-acetylmuramoyl-L-alanine amidase [Clostridium sp. SYSU_GA19001]|uniref:N-acetylmuramoyl-L-alanine amidase family protein n=1 Tax=Clostridium caldaquaticum TaxID=2940653 RepID=UPI00207730F4|nr:N-acetylmuramoyl-L-alanine amidase [Clostridium caldaquaticum]MCM8710081.1 N-acetylmuramoyl-L-alanine amidase [Clostridium caldaquaticum]